MKRIARLAVAALFSVALTVSFTGCSSDEIALFEASLKMQTANSMETKTDINLSLEVTGLSEESRQLMEVFLSALKDIKITVNQKVNQNDARTVAQAQVDMTIEASGLKANAGLWIDSDFSGEKPVLKQIIKPPSIIGMFVPPQAGIKEYIIYDLGEAMNTSGAGDYSSIVEFQQKQQLQLVEFVRKYIQQFNPGFTVAERKESRTVSGRPVTVYEARFDDASFKAFIRYAINNFLQNEDALSFLKESMLSSAYISQSAASQAGKPAPDPEKTVEDFMNSIPQFLEQANKLLDALESVQILGDKGILVEYFVDDEGYVVGESGTADIVIDINALAEFFAKLVPPKEGTPAASPLTPEGIWRIGVNYNTEVYNINKDVEIEFPELTSENSVNYTDLMKSLQPAPEPGDSVRVVVNGRLLTFDVPPMVSEGRILVPVRGVFEALGAEVSWDGNTQTVTGVKGNKTVILKLNSRDALVNGSPCTLDVPATAVDGRVLVPVRFVSESLGAKVEWDQATRTAIIIGQEVIDMLDSVETVDI